MLLRATEERRYRPVGGQRDRLMDVRIIAATQLVIQEAVAEKRFRKDCLRFQDFTITVPHWQNCLEDILPLADFFWEQSCGLLRKEVLDFDEPAKKKAAGIQLAGKCTGTEAGHSCGGFDMQRKTDYPQFLRLQYCGSVPLTPWGKRR